MEQRPDIWHRLKDHPTPPPAEVLENLRHRLEAAAGDEKAVFHKLGDHSIPPPDHLRSAISAAVTPARRKSGGLSWPYMTAAASILFLVIGFAVYRVSHTDKTAVAGNKGRNPNQAIPADTNAHSLATAPPARPADVPGDSTVFGSPQAEQLLPFDLSVDDQKFPLTENSLLATFTGYHYPALGSHLNHRKNETSLHIHLDQYTNITLSPAMTATLRELYDTRPDGSPNRKARKTRERLEKWNAEDQKEFDPGYATNPLDPIDLAEFLFPPLFSFGRHAAPLPPAGPTKAVAGANHPANPGPANPTPADAGPLTVSYTLTLVTKRTNTGIGETYNGGVQTLFEAAGHTRLRLASLMRIQSVFMTPDARTVTILTESAKPRHEIVLTTDQWSRYNGKYTGMTRDLIDDSAVILGYSCKKALIKLHDGRRITAWYTPLIQEPVQTRMEPAFAGIPGLVLRYEYTCRRKTIRYTAATLSRQPIDASVFAPFFHPMQQ